jgi:hypothetical protein
MSCSVNPATIARLPGAAGVGFEAAAGGGDDFDAEDG